MNSANIFNIIVISKAYHFVIYSFYAPMKSIFDPL